MTTEFRLTQEQQALALPLMMEPGRSVLGSCHWVDQLSLADAMRTEPALFVRLGTVPASAVPRLRKEIGKLR